MSDAWFDISDAGSELGEPYRLALSWQVGAVSTSVETAFTSPVTPHTESLIASYVQSFRSWRARVQTKEHDASYTAERTLLTLGRALGSNVCDPDLRLLSFCDELERQGAASCRVSIRSDRAAVMAVPWEALILPDAKFVLAASGAAFVRAPAAFRPLEEAPRKLELHAQAGQPLGYLLLDSRSDAAGPAFRVPNLWSSLTWPGAINFEASAELPTASERPRHIVHFVGKISQQNTEHLDELSLATDGGQHALLASDFIDRLRALDTELLIIEPTSGSASADELARRALLGGIANVLVLSQTSELGWPSDWTEHLLSHIASGFGLHQAVVEVRKQLQRAMLIARQGDDEPAHAPEMSHALRHYSTRDVVFFAAEQPRVALEASEVYGALRQRLFGFDSRHLPPEAPQLGDRTAWALLRELHDAVPGAGRGTLLVTAAQGGGLSHALHRAALLSIVLGRVERAYYWDLERESFSVRDVLEMVAGIHGTADPALVSEASVLTELQQRRELFVFDNFHAAAGGDEMLALCDRLARAGGLCLVGTHADVSQYTSRRSWQLPLLSETECLALIKARIPEALSLGGALVQLLDCVHGLPGLLRLLLARCSQEQLPQATKEASEQYGKQVQPAEVLAAFHSYQWSQLPAHWQQLLRALLPLEGLYMEILMLAVDSPGGAISPSGRQLWSLLGVPDDASLQSVVVLLRQTGLAVQERLGTALDTSVRRFVSQQTVPALPEALARQVAAVVCEGLLRLLDRQGSQQVDALIPHLLRHRACLRHEIDQLLGAGQYAPGGRAFLKLHGLLQKASFAREADQWAQSAIETIGTSFGTVADPAQATIWLSIALRAPLQPPSAALANGAHYWSQALTHGDLERMQHARSLAPLAVAFLEAYFDAIGDQESFRTVARKAAELYRSAGDVAGMAQQLTALAAVEHLLGNHSERDRLEHELLHEVTFSDDAVGSTLRQRTLGQLATLRLQRADADGAERIAEQLDCRASGGAPSVAVDMLRGEIAVQREHWEVAAGFFCKLWKLTMKGTRGLDPAAVARRLHWLEHRLGAERYAELYERHAERTPTPATLGITFSTPSH